MQKRYLKDLENFEIGSSVVYTDEEVDGYSIRNACWRIKKKLGICFKVKKLSPTEFKVTRCS